MPQFDIWLTLITIVGVMAVIVGLCSYLIFLERKVSAWMQNRFGPNRVGPWGLLQPIADGLKFLLKEDIIPDHVDKLLYVLAPAIAVTTAFLAFAVVPFGPTSPLPRTLPFGPSAVAAGKYETAMTEYRDAYQFVIAPNVDIGIVFVFAVTSLTVYAIILGGWASNNKYSFLGALRSSAQLVSYEIPMGMSILGLVLLTGSLNLERIIAQQVPEGVSSWQGFFGWNIWYQPLAFLLFLISVFAECNRLPFDLPEAEQELIGGYHTEYSALKFGMFFLGEYTHVVTTSFLLVILFFGGWHFPWIAEPGSTGLGSSLVKMLVFIVKMTSFILFYMLVRWTIPRFRFDQLMTLAWKVMIPLALANLVTVMVVKHMDFSLWVLLPVSLGWIFGAALVAGCWPREPKRMVMVTRGYEQVETVAS
jgi:NADH-quinone oxidoreductase subunit H